MNRRENIFNFPFSAFDSRGFTLLELLVAMGIFAVVVTIAAGGFVTSLRTQRQTAALLAADSNVSLSLEQMVREIRTGYYFCHDPSGNPTCHNSSGVLTAGPVTADLSFINASFHAVTYGLVGGAIQRGVGTNFTNQVFQPITGSKALIWYLTFVLRGNLSGDYWPPRITVSLGVGTNVLGLTGNVAHLQTTVSARQLDS